MSKKSFGTGITRLLFGLGKKEMKVIPYNEMSSEQFEQLDRFLGKVGFAAATDTLSLTKRQSEYIFNQIKQLDLYRKNMMRDPDLIKADKMTKIDPEFKGFTPKVIEGGKGKTKPGSKIDYGKMSEFLGVKLRGDETFDELLEIEKRMKNKDPEDFAGGGLVNLIAKLRAKFGKKAITTADKIDLPAKSKLKNQFKAFEERNRKLTDEEYEDLVEEYGEGVPQLETVADAERFVQGQKDYQAAMFRDYKAGKLDPKPGEPGRKRLLEKKMEEMEMSGDKKLMTQDEIDELMMLQTEELAPQMTERMNLKIKYPGITDDLIQKIMIDDNPQRKAEVLATLDEAFKMMDKGMSPDEILNAVKNTPRTKQADGGLATMFRPKLKDGGPPNPGRRNFMKVMAGLASLPFVGKLFKGAKVAKTVVPLKNTTTAMPAWFPNFVDKMVTKNVGNKIDADVMLFKDKDLPGVELRKYDDGRIQVEGKNAYNEEYYIDYEPPGYEVVDETTGRAVKKPGDFVATDTEYRMISPEDYDVDGVNVDKIDDILGGNSTQLEGYAKGTGEVKYTTGQKRIDEADARGASKDESLRADINDPYGDVDPTDFADDYAKGGLATMFRKK